MVHIPPDLPEASWHMPREMTDKAAADALASAAKALYGDHWRIELGRALDVNPDTIRRFMSGRMHIPPVLLITTLALVRQRVADLAKAAERLKEALPTPPK